MRNTENTEQETTAVFELGPRFPNDDVWYDDMKTFTSTVIYSDIESEVPTNINHLSNRTRYVVAGDGVATVGGKEIPFSQGDEMIIPKGVPTSLIGRCSLLTTIEPILIPRFCTIGDEKLSREDKRALKKIEKSIDTIQQAPFSMEQLVMKMMHLENRFSSYLELANREPLRSK